MIELTEKKLVGKRPDQRLCEDGIFINDGFAAVIDGVTSKGRQCWVDGLSSGGYAKEIILHELENMPHDTDKDMFFEKLDLALGRAYNIDIVNDDISEWLRACVIVYSDFYRQIWVLGDCACMVNGVAFDNSKQVDSILSNLRAMVIEKALKDGMDEDELYTNDCGRNAVLPLTPVQFVFENDIGSRFGYGVLNGHGVQSKFIKVIDVAVSDTVVLASDGYLQIASSLEKSEQLLESALKNDPHCYKYNPGTKGIVKGNCSFDDRAYIKFTVR